MRLREILVLTAFFAAQLSDDIEGAGKEIARLGELQSRLAGHKSPIRALAISPDGKTLASASWGNVLLWDLVQLKPTQLFQGRGDGPELFSSLARFHEVGSGRF
jgi:WD40 repeat protein